MANKEMGVQAVLQYNTKLFPNRKDGNTSARQEYDENRKEYYDEREYGVSVKFGEQTKEQREHLTKNILDNEYWQMAQGMAKEEDFRGSPQFEGRYKRSDFAKIYVRNENGDRFLYSSIANEMRNEKGDVYPMYQNLQIDEMQMASGGNGDYSRFVKDCFTRDQMRIKAGDKVYNGVALHNTIDQESFNDKANDLEDGLVNWVQEAHEKERSARQQTNSKML